MKRPKALSLSFLVGMLLTCGFAQAKDTYQRHPEIDAIHYRVQLKVNPADSVIAGVTGILIALNAPDVSQIPLDFGALTVDSVTVDDRRAVFTHSGERLTVKLDATNVPGVRVAVKVAYHGIPKDGLFIKANKFGNRTAFADNWPNRAHHWFPCIDHPYDKALVSFIIEAPADYDVVANGTLEETTYTGNGSKTTHWDEATPIPTYCMVIGVARFSIIHAGSWNGIPATFYLYPEDRENGLLEFGHTLRILEFFTQLIGPYPYEKLAQVESSTRFGGMENASAIFYDEKAVNGSGRMEGTVAHEVAHQWFGDSVTGADWHHVWLSEGFATYLTAVYFERWYGHARFLDQMKRSKARYLERYAKTPGPINDSRITEPFGLLNAYPYSKGAWTLHMLRGLMDDNTFFNGIRAYYRTYRDRVVLTEDFQRVMEAHYGKPLDWFFHQWINESGHPVFSTSWKWDVKRKEVRIAVRQTQVGVVYRTPLSVSVTGNGETVSRSLDLTERNTVVTLPFATHPDQIVVDPDEWVLKESTIHEEK